MPESYLWQAMFYCMALKLDHVLILQIGRNQGLAKHRTFELTDEWRDEIDLYMAKARTAWDTYKTYGTIPAHTHNFGWENKFCAYI